MSSRIKNLRHTFGGGWATDFGPNADVVPDASGHVSLPFLVDAENVYYELDGGPHKIGGTTRVNSSAVASGAVITGCYDYWRHGTAGSQTRRRIVQAGTTTLADVDDGTFSTTITSGLSSGSVPNFEVFDDILVISNDSTVDVPRSWNQTTAANLAGSPPRFSFSCKHKSFLFAAGVYAAPSTLYWSGTFDPETWSGGGAGSIQVSPDDGDMITGLASYKNELIIFKGPNKGSIHRLTGSSSSDFALVPFVKSGLGCAWQNCVFQFKDDLGWVSQFGTVHSLKTTAAFGDFNEAALSLPIHKWIKDHLNYNRLRYIWAAVNPQDGYALFTISIDSSSTNNAVLMMDFRRWPDERPRWAYWPAYAMGSLGLFVDTNGVRRIMGGGNDGFLNRLMTADRSLNASTAISAKVTTPYLSYGDPMLMKSIYTAAIGIAPKNDNNVTFGWQRDTNAQQTITVDQNGGDVLGPSSVNPFTLGTSTLAGATYTDRYMELTEGGEFRNIQYQVTDAILNSDLELHSISAGIVGGAVSTEN